MWRWGPENDEDWLNKIYKILDMNFRSIKKHEMATCQLFYFQVRESPAPPLESTWMVKQFKGFHYPKIENLPKFHSIPISCFPYLKIKKLSSFHFMFFDRYVIHIQTFVEFINVKLIISRSSPPRNSFWNMYSFFHKKMQKLGKRIDNETKQYGT